MTEEEKNEIINAIRAESVDVNDLEKAETLDDATSLPATQNGKVVTVPISLLAKPAIDAAANADAAAEHAEEEANKATEAAISANKAAEEAQDISSEFESKLEKEISDRQIADTENKNLIEGDPETVKNNIRNPFIYLGNFDTWTETQVELDKLHSQGEDYTTKVGEFRMQLNNRNIIVRNFVQNWATGVFTQTVQGSIQWNTESQTMDQSLNINTYERRYNEGTGWTTWEEGTAKIELAQELGDSDDKILSQKVVTDEILKNRVETPNDLKKYNGWMDTNGNYTTLVPSSFSLIPINAGDNIIITASDSYPLNFAFLKNALTPINDSEKFPLCLNQSRVTIQASETTEALIAPDDAKFLYVSNVYQGSKRFPKKIQINGVEYTPYITPSTLYNINIANDSYTTKYNSLVEAISTIPISMRSVGMIITFSGDNDSWNTYQFKGSEVEDSAFLLENNWLSYTPTSSENNSYVSKKINVVCEKDAVTSTGLIYSKLIEELMTTPVFISFNAKYNQVFNVTCGDDWELRLFQYDTEKEFIIASNFSQNNTKININPNTRFVKFNLRKKDLSNVPTAHTITINVNAGENDKIFSYNTNKGSYPLSKDGTINIQSYLRISSPNANDSNSTDVQDNDDTIYTDYGILMLPKSYNADGNATPLIVFCHGYSVHYTYNSTIIASSSYLKIDYLLSEGYAIMDMDGNPMSSDYGHCGSPMAIQSYLRGIKWVQDRFNVGKKIYLAGHSMGGLMAHCLCNLGVLNINACCLFSPATSMLMLMELVPNAKDSIANYYGLTGKRPTWSQTKGDLSDEEKTFVFSDENILKWSYSSLLWAKNCDIDYATISNFANKYISDPTEEEIAYYSAKHKLTNVPIKFFQGEADKSCYLGWSKLIVKEYINAGENVEYRTFENAVHDGVNSVTSCGSNTVVTLNGDEYTDIPTPQLEMVLFFKKYQ